MQRPLQLTSKARSCTLFNISTSKLDLEAGQVAQLESAKPKEI
jgi:hypothetical protein